jgi:putative lipoprotein (rSAM/lipoprotein system)
LPDHIIISQMSFIKRNTFFVIILVFVLISMVFNSGCKKKEENKTPYGDYIFRGIVKSDKTLAPIKNIKVSLANYGNKNIITQDDGTYYFEYYHVAVTSDWNFKLEDTDSTENGLFENKDTLITLNQSFLHNYDGQWYAGRVESNIEITMKDKNE